MTRTGIWMHYCFTGCCPIPYGATVTHVRIIRGGWTFRYDGKDYECARRDLKVED
jgi:hypothetical protein